MPRSPKVDQPKTEAQLLSEAVGLLRALVSLNAAASVEGLKQTAAIQKLSRYGLTAEAISDATGAPLTTVRPEMSKSKSKETGPSKK